MTSKEKERLKTAVKEMVEGTLEQYFDIMDTREYAKSKARLRHYGTRLLDLVDQQPTEEKDEYEILLPPLHFEPGKPLVLLSTGELKRENDEG